MKTEILHEAEEELIQAIAYYEEVEIGLGRRLQAEARQAIAWIQTNPLLPSVWPKGYRRVNLRVFPYYVAYFI